MIKAIVNSKSEFNIEPADTESEYLLQGVNPAVDLKKLTADARHALKDYKSYNIEVVSRDFSSKTFTININGRRYVVQLKDKYDELLHRLGLDKVRAKKVNEIRAPMPGLVKNILITDGQQVNEGDAIIILEAMKMENILKAPAPAVVKSIAVSKGNTVEKNEVLVTFD